MSDPRLRTVAYEWDRFDEVLALCYRVLYEPFGVSRDGDWFQPDAASEFVVALSAEDGLLGVARLLPLAADGTRQARQVAVAPSARERGVGRFLMMALEDIASRQGAIGIWLCAREGAVGFYEALGYVPEGPEFESELTGIPHRKMSRSLR